MKIVGRVSQPGTRAVAWAITGVVTCVVAAGCGSSGASGSGGAATTTIGIVELNLSNPFFGTLENATEAAAQAKGWKVMKAEAKVPGDSATQVTAIENMIAA